MATATTTFSFNATRPLPPPATLQETFAFQTGNFIINLLSKNYSGIFYKSEVAEAPTGAPNNASASVSASHAFPFVLQAELPESLFITLWAAAATHGWVIANRTILTTPDP